MRNTLEDIDRREEIKRRNKEKKAKLAMTMTRSALQESAISQYASMATIPVHPNVTDVSGNATSFPAVGKTQAALATTKAGGKEKTFLKPRMPKIEPVTPAEVRAKAKKEVAFMRSPPRDKSAKGVGKLKPLKKAKNRPRIEMPERKEECLTHMEIINLIEDSKSEEPEKYYYCVKGKNFYEFYACHFEDINTEQDDYITVSSRGVTHFIKDEAEFLTLSEWRDEVENYKKMNDISFFKNFRIGKSFTLWKRLVKRTKMIERGSFLKKELFLADPNINTHLVSIRRKLNKLRDRDILQVLFIVP